MNRFFIVHIMVDAAGLEKPFHRTAKHPLR